jgi:hypothetical protein
VNVCGYRIVNGDPKHPDSWTDYCDDHGRLIARTCASDPNNQNSWRDVFDDDGNHVTRIYGEQW